MKKITKAVCPICGSTDLVELYKSNANLKKIVFTYEFSIEAKKTFRVVKCKQCTHVFCNPIPENIYKYYVDVVDKKYLTQEEDRKVTARKLIQKIKKYKKKGNLLDIGCATGDFLEIAKLFGYNAEGLELSKWSADIARKKGLKIHNSTIYDFAKKNPNKYDVITLWGVIEHFENPKLEMENINKLLKPKGIVIVWTGDVESITSRIMKRNWWYWLGQHIQYFTRASLKLLGENTGFEQVFSSIYPQAVSYDKVENSMARYKNKKLLTFFKYIFYFKKFIIVYIPGEIFWMGKKVKSVQ